MTPPAAPVARVITSPAAIGSAHAGHFPANLATVTGTRAAGNLTGPGMSSSEAENTGILTAASTG